MAEDRPTGGVFGDGRLKSCSCRERLLDRMSATNSDRASTVQNFITIKAYWRAPGSRDALLEGDGQVSL